MLITRSQGAACRRAAERIAEGRMAWRECNKVKEPLRTIGWFLPGGYFGGEPNIMAFDYNRSQVILALLWCATIAGEE